MSTGTGGKTADGLTWPDVDGLTWEEVDSLPWSTYHGMVAAGQAYTPSPTARINTAYISAGLPAAPIFSSTLTSSIGSITSYSTSTTQYTPPIIVLTRYFTPLQLFQNTI